MEAGLRAASSHGRVADEIIRAMGDGRISKANARP